MSLTISQENTFSIKNQNLNEIFAFIYKDKSGKNKSIKLHNINAKFKTEVGEINVRTPFVLIMNGINIGGFPVNFKNSTTDGKFDIYLTKPGLFDALLHFLFFKIRTKHIRASEINVSTDSKMPWCVDAEPSICGDLSIKCLPKHISIFCAKKYENNDKIE